MSILLPKKEADVTEISYIHSIWKGKHILIEFPTTVANEVAQLQIDTPGCKSSGTVAQANFYRKKEDLHRRVYRSERELLKCIDEYISFYNSSRPHRNNDYKSPDDAKKCSKKQ